MTVSRNQGIVLGVASGVVLVALLVYVIVSTAPVRGAVRAYTEIVYSAQAQDLARVRALCTERYLKTHPIVEASEGGVKGVPRNIDKNFQAWRQGENVWLCPTNRVGPVYQFVPSPDGWRFDGPIGLLQSNGKVQPLAESGVVEPSLP